MKYTRGIFYIDTIHKLKKLFINMKMYINMKNEAKFDTG